MIKIFDKFYSKYIKLQLEYKNYTILYEKRYYHINKIIKLYFQIFNYN